MNNSILGLHHVTAIAADPQRNLDFYTQVLGLRFVKLTVNFDDPGTYHFYFGNEAAAPGSVITFFPWTGAARGRIGAGQSTATAYAVPKNSLAHWTESLADAGLVISASERFGMGLLAFHDPDGMPLELIASAPASDNPAIIAFDSVTLTLADPSRTAALLTETMGLSLVGEENGRARYALGEGGPGQRIDLLTAAGRGAPGAGTTHHIAWRLADDASQAQWQKKLLNLGYQVSPVKDRDYFHSIYFREPGGVLFELATDPPGFAVDEAPEALGTALKLPKQYEPRRAEIERALPKLRLPG